MHVVPVFAYGFAGTFRPKEIVTLIAPAGASVRVTKTMAVAQHGGADCFVVVLDFGAVVFFDVDENARKQAISKILETVGPEPHPPVMEDFLVEVKQDATERASTASFDRAVVSKLDVEVVEIFALVLAQSVAMDYYDEDVEFMFRKVDDLSKQLAERGRLRPNTRELARLVGQILVTRNQIAMTLSLLDAPIATWVSEPHDRIYRAMRQTFEIEDRYRTLTHKLGVIQDDLEIVVDLVRSRRGFILETLVVVLIAIELVVAVLQLWR